MAPPTKVQTDPNTQSTLTQAQASALTDSKEWMTWTDRERAVFQLRQEYMCMPWRVLQDSVSKALGRQVASSELSNAGPLLDELGA